MVEKSYKIKNIIFLAYRFKGKGVKMILNFTQKYVCNTKVSRDANIVLNLWSWCKYSKIILFFDMERLL